MLDDLIKEIQELQEYKRKYECALKDKQTMSDKLYEYMMDEYNNTSYEERSNYHIEHWCQHLLCNTHFTCHISNPFLDHSRDNQIYYLFFD